MRKVLTAMSRGRSVGRSIEFVWEMAGTERDCDERYCPERDVVEEAKIDKYCTGW